MVGRRNCWGEERKILSKEPMPGRVEGQAMRVHGKSQDICFAYTPGAIREDGRQILSKLVLEKTRGWQEGVCVWWGEGGAQGERRRKQTAHPPPLTLPLRG